MNDELAYRVWYTTASSSEVKSELLSYGRDSTHPGEAERYIYASMNWVIFGSDNGLSPVRRQVTIFVNVPMGTKFSEIRVKNNVF